MGIWIISTSPTPWRCKIMGALVFLPIFLLVLGVGGYVFIFFLFAVYRLTGGGDLSGRGLRLCDSNSLAPAVFRGGFPAMLSTLPCPVFYALLGFSVARYALFMPCPISYHCHTFTAFVHHSMGLYDALHFRPFPGDSSGFFPWGIQGC